VKNRDFTPKDHIFSNFREARAGCATLGSTPVLTFLAWYRHFNKKWRAEASCIDPDPQALVSLKKYMSHPLPYFKVNICPLSLSHFASICFAYL